MELTSTEARCGRKSPKGTIRLGNAQYYDIGKSAYGEPDPELAEDMAELAEAQQEKLAEKRDALLASLHTDSIITKRDQPAKKKEEE